MDYQIYQVALSPDLNLSAEEFADAWNATRDTRELAIARLSIPKGISYYEPLLTSVQLASPINIESNTIYEAIRTVISRYASAKKGKGQATPATPHIEEVQRPGGARVLVVDVDR
ncbi:MAG TPA: hypothetical protein VKV20_09200 [Ktedonobacteraceae bacterium]|nr:hypothetical protein [Ktedonobacteraceae bacterium]